MRSASLLLGPGADGSRGTRARAGHRAHRLRPSLPRLPTGSGIKVPGTDGRHSVAQPRDEYADLASVLATLRSEDPLTPLPRLASLAEAQAKLAAIRASEV
ncbi:MAG TPA: hypothetical protein VNB87_13680 [Propionibacteriaceae bacterium]|nr:hypothetical protein [Propionibacteriaceae bacterium]